MELNRDQMLERIRDAGVVGAGGAGFPTHVKLDASVEVVIANGAECEPLARVDQQQMALQPAELLRGLRIAMACTGAERGVIALKAKYAPAIEALAEQLRLQRLGDAIALHELDNFYPAGDEFVLVRDVLGRVIPEFGLPLHVGAVVSNVSTLIDVAAAVDRRQPVCERAVTVAGRVAAPASFRVPLGTPLAALVAAAGGATVAEPHLIAGGPMMGQLAAGEQPVVKTTSAVLVLERSHPVVQRRLRSVARQVQLTRSACLKCMMCTEVCPRNALGHRLVPDRLMRNLAAGVAEDPQAFASAFVCSECGLCAVYGCVMGLDPCAVNHEMKKQLSAAGVDRPEPTAAPERVYGPLRRVPSARLVARLGLADCDAAAPLAPFDQPLQRLRLPLNQHTGAPAVPCVAAGEPVAAGQAIGEIPPGALGARIHAPRAGRLVDWTDDTATIELG